MVQRGGVAGLRHEPRPEGRVVGELLLEHLDGDLTVEHGVVGSPDLAHSAGRDPARELVAAAVLAHRHLLITASITRFAMGAARPLPEIASRSTPASSTSTATATFGSSAGAKDTNQA